MYPRAPLCPRSPTREPHTPQETSPHSTDRPARRSEHSAQQMTCMEGEICKGKKKNNNYSESRRASLSASCSHQSHARPGPCRQGQMTTIPAKLTDRHTSPTRTQESKQGRTEAHREMFTQAVRGRRYDSTTGALPSTSGHRGKKGGRAGGDGNWQDAGWLLVAGGG